MAVKNTLYGGVQIYDAPEAGTLPEATVLARNNETGDIVTVTLEGGGTVESVTGNVVDNTDPANPVINTPTLQEVTTEGNNSTNNIIVSNGTNSVDVGVDIVSFKTTGDPDSYIYKGAGTGISVIGYDGINLENVTGDITITHGAGAGQLNINTTNGIVWDAASVGKMKLKANSGIQLQTGTPIGTLNLDTLSGNQTYDFPDASGTIALLSDIPAGGGTVTSVTGTTNEITVATGTTTPVIGISSAYTAARAAYADAKVQNSLTASTTVAPSATAVNNALAGKADIVEYPETTYAQTISYTAGTAPSGTLTANWRASQVGKHVTGRINANYTVAGASVTQIRIPLPTGLPAPSAITGFTGASDYLFPVLAYYSTSPSTTPLAAVPRGGIRKDGSGGFEIFLISSSAAMQTMYMTFEYFID